MCAADFGMLYNCYVDNFELVNKIASSKFQAMDLCMCIRMFLNIPMHVASLKRSFNKLKLVKNYLKSSVNET